MLEFSLWQCILILMIYHLSYISRSTDKLSNDELSALEDKSSFNNVKADITGFLVYDGSHFFQYIEGPKENIEKLFLKISSDPRHMSVTELSRGKVDERILPNWSMKSFLPSDFVAEDRLHILDLLSQKHEKESIPNILMSLQFRQQAN